MGAQIITLFDGGMAQQTRGEHMYGRRCWELKNFASSLDFRWSATARKLL